MATAPVDKRAALLPGTKKFALTEKQEAYCAARQTMRPRDAYVATYDIREGTLPQSLVMGAHNVECLPHIQARIRELRDAAASPFVLDRGRVIKKLLNIAFADIGELADYRRSACRRCHGEGHEYHWRDEHEYAAACDEALERKGANLPSAAGGFGYRADLPPVDECPQCDGEGEARVFLADTRSISGPARDLIKGFKMTRNGPELVLHDQAAALSELANMLGLTRNDLTLLLADPNTLPETKTEGKTLEQLTQDYLRLTP